MFTIVLWRNFQYSYGIPFIPDMDPFSLSLRAISIRSSSMGFPKFSLSGLGQCLWCHLFSHYQIDIVAVLHRHCGEIHQNFDLKFFSCQGNIPLARLLEPINS